MWLRRILMSLLAVAFLIASLIWLRPPQPLPGDLPSSSRELVETGTDGGSARR